MCVCVLQNHVNNASDCKYFVLNLHFALAFVIDSRETRALICYYLFNYALSFSFSILYTALFCFHTHTHTRTNVSKPVVIAVVFASTHTHVNTYFLLYLCLHSY